MRTSWLAAWVLAVGCYNPDVHRCVDPGTACPVGDFCGADQYCHACPPGDREGQVRAGGDHTCAVSSEGTVWCWGENAGGELGDGTKTNRGEPLRVMDLADVRQVAVGNGHSCAIAGSDGNVYCWGAGPALGIPDRATPGLIPGLSDAVEIGTGDLHTCVRKQVDGTIWCWGSNDRGQLGDGSTADSSIPVQVHLPDPARAVQLAVGNTFGCALSDADALYCWGEADNGQLAHDPITSQGTCDVACDPTPRQVDGIAGIAGISAGLAYACAWTRDGEVLCWGENYSGQLGDGGSPPRFTPAPVAVGQRAVEVAAGAYTTCARTVDGQLSCWGDNQRGQLGNGHVELDPQTPGLVLGNNGQPLEGVAAETVGFLHACARTLDGATLCWGDNAYGQLSVGTIDFRGRPTQLGSGPADLVAAGSFHTCARSSLGSHPVSCWGWNGHGQIGNNSTVDQLTPTVVLEAAGTSISAGGAHSCAITSEGTAQCWGANDDGELANGGGASLEPTVFGGGAPLPNVQQIVAGGAHVCALNTSGEVWCTGKNFEGQLGTGDTSPHLAPVQVIDSSSMPLGGVVQIEAGKYHTCARRLDGSVWCWGANAWGQLGDNLTDDSPVAMQVMTASAALANATQIAAGGEHSCAVVGGEAYCWGHGEAGQLGRADPMSPVAKPALGISGIESIRAGYDHTCANKLDDTVWCWGSDSSGQLCDGMQVDRATPAEVPMLADTGTLALGDFHTCAVKTDGTVWCCGFNNAGQIGDGTRSAYTTAQSTRFTCP